MAFAIIQMNSFEYMLGLCGIRAIILTIDHSHKKVAFVSTTSKSNFYLMVKRRFLCVGRDIKKFGKPRISPCIPKMSIFTRFDSSYNLLRRFKYLPTPLPLKVLKCHMHYFFLFLKSPRPPKS